MQIHHARPHPQGRWASYRQLLTYEAVERLRLGIGQSTCIGIGSDQAALPRRLDAAITHAIGVSKSAATSKIQPQLHQREKPVMLSPDKPRTPGRRMERRNK